MLSISIATSLMFMIILLCLTQDIVLQQKFAMYFFHKNDGPANLLSYTLFVVSLDSY